MSIGSSNPPPVDSGSYGLLVDSVGRLRQVVEDCLTLGDWESAFSALAVYDRRVEELGAWLRDAARAAQEVAINEEAGS